MKGDFKPRIAVVSPFLDKRHGTELCVAEQIERLADEFDFHIYSTRISDMDTRKFNWHRIPDVPGPHLLKYIWFFCANHAVRWSEHLFGKPKPELTYSPGINCFDADVISVHIVFAEFRRLARANLAFRANPVRSWVRLIHRRVFYRLIIWLENRIYRRRLPLIAVSSKVKAALSRHYRVEDAIVIPNAISSRRFNPEVRNGSRVAARQALRFSSCDFVLLLIGNDWRKKGLLCLLQALALSKTEQLKLAVVGRDEVSHFRAWVERYELGSRVRFLPERADPEFYYAAADAYVGPSMEDAFAIPPLEAMACGLPTIVSSRAGVSEIVTHGIDALVLNDPESPSELDVLIAQIYGHKEYREQLSRNAVKTASQFTWERNAEQMRNVFRQLLARTHARSVAAPRTV
ncbi:MAG TPA: glycosyltransferase family 4 protein [Terriglobales bacterium]|nr:glycosyltransferase family 4 protein [Terriglobales bacterium]